MKTFFGLSRISREGLKRPIVTLGMFDGVHRGHRAILDVVTSWRDEVGGTAILLTFRQHPRSVLSGEPVPLITSLRHRLRLFGEAGIDVAIVLTFDTAFSRISAEDFVRDLLVAKIGMHGIVLGPNAKFGHRALGDLSLLRSLGPTHSFEVRTTQPLTGEGQLISSSRLRQWIQTGNLESAARWLGRPVSVLGTVVKGAARGRSLGFPTANLDLHHEIRPPRGVYAVRARVREQWKLGMCNIGRRPTFDNLPEDLVEVHLFDFESDLYGEHLEVQFLSKLREERKFDSPEKLKEDLREQETRVRARFAPGPTRSNIEA